MQEQLLLPEGVYNFTYHQWKQKPNSLWAAISSNLYLNPEVNWKTLEAKEIDLGTNGQLISTIKYEDQRFAIFDRDVCSHSLLPTHVDLFSLTEEFLFIPLHKKNL